MEHVDSVAADTEPELDAALARAIRLLISGAAEAPVTPAPPATAAGAGSRRRRAARY